ncbi:MAG TPA: DUF4253 domain-containing protein [Ktedonobacterales bacterium]|nr:DUF4253 domain-containing protein [Ktedonobacterales bacterium]
MQQRDLQAIFSEQGVDVTSLRPLFPLHDQVVYVLAAPRAQALDCWAALRALVPVTGYWPVIGWDRLLGPPWKTVAPETIIDRALQLDVPHWFQEEGIASALDPVREATYGHTTCPPLAFHIHEQRAFPFTLPPSVAPIALIPVNGPWQVPAYLQLGGMDTWGHTVGRIGGVEGAHGMEPQVHMAILKYWYERWGAEAVAATAADLEVRVLRPPTTPAAALELAKEQYLYCRDLVDQHTGSVTVLAKLLLDSPVWWFWWD